VFVGTHANSENVQRPTSNVQRLIEGRHCDWKFKVRLDR
jgi:hypothetical protein